VSPIDVDQLSAVLRNAALAEIMPRFRRLAGGDIRQKTSAIDLVTEADEAAERFIAAECARLWPQANFVGEEGVAADERKLASVGSADLSIVVDPIDGTANFASGAPLFAVMAAVVWKGETVAGIIYDPLGDDFVVAEKGAGAFLKRADGEAIRQSYATPVALADMVGMASSASLPTAAKRALLVRLAEVKVIGNFRCAGHEYRLAGTGHLHFNLYHKLMPWDHLGGALIVEEAGGYVRRLDGSAYLPSHTEGGLLCATDADRWRVLRDTIYPDLA
jgi:fructose-1,6-bisphosphatase/inositol monophosphatase family enzyme